jgi:hypothetical protein
LVAGVAPGLAGSVPGDGAGIAGVVGNTAGEKGCAVGKVCGLRIGHPGAFNAVPQTLHEFARNFSAINGTKSTAIGVLAILFKRMPK